MSNLLKIHRLAILIASLLLILTATLVLTFIKNLQSVPQISHHPHIVYKEGLATNWAGYATETDLANPQLNAVSDVRSSWIVPSLKCDFLSSYSSSWTGIDGYQSATVEQIGTEADCYHGKPSYFAWYEIYPSPLHVISLPVKAGDQIEAQVSYRGSDKFLLTIKNGSQSFSTTQLTKADRSSAEWIAEAPSFFSFILPLANFGTEHFISAQATINGHTGLPTDHAWQYDPLTMVTWYGTVKASPSAIGTNGAFDVTWNHR